MGRAALGRGQALQPSSVVAHSREPTYQAKERLIVAQARCTRSSMDIQGVRHTVSQAFVRQQSVVSILLIFVHIRTTMT
jgi:hypothetical protein